ncbi:hypothetical protein GOODEAATRI_028302, partial [Goodea atripinnis]
EMQNIHELGQAYTLTKVGSLLKNRSLSEEAVNQICDCIKESDLFSACHQGQLKSTYSRNQTFTKMSTYTEPQKVALRLDENMTQKLCLLHTGGTNSFYSHLCGGIQSHNSVEMLTQRFLQIYMMDKISSITSFLMESLKLILYQDSFVVNPLDSAKRTHK